MKKILSKTLKTSLVVGLFISLMAASCKKEVEGPVAYYNFTAEDYTRILELKLNDTIIYENQQAEEIKLVVWSVDEDLKRFYSIYGYPTSTSFFNYDYIIIWAYFIDSDLSSMRYYFKRFPLDLEEAKADKYTKYSSAFKAKISLPLYNGGYEEIDYDSDKTEMTIGSEIYRDVFTIASGINDSVYNEDEDYYKKVNILYYDEFNGLIAFDDILGNNWLLKK